jgi:hypothetical protein
MALITLASCNQRTVEPEYPLNISSVLKVENDVVEYSADYKFSDGKSSFIIIEPAILKGLEIAVFNNEITVAYNEINLKYDIADSNRFGAFKDLNNILMKLNEVQPDFTYSGEQLYSVIEYSGEKVRIILDDETLKIDTVKTEKTLFDFD